MAQERLPKYRQIYDHVHESIQRGKYRPGARIPTEMELASRFGASRMTVSRALRDLETKGLLLRRHGAGTFVRERVAGPHKAIGVFFPMFPGFDSSIWNGTTLEIARLVQAAGYELILGDPIQGGVDATLEDPTRSCEPYLAKEAACVLFTPVELPPSQMGANGRIAEAFERAGIPIVLVDRDICDFPERSRHDLVGIDNFGASYALTQHLLKLGHRRLHYVGTSAVAATVTARIAGYQSALLAHDIVPQPEWIHRGDPSSLEFVRELVKTASADVFLCSNDHVAAFLMRHLTTMGVRIPDDLAVVGFDDTAFAPLLASPLTTIRQPDVELGAAAVRMVMQRLAEPGMPTQEIRLSCELVVRESCGAAKDSARAGVA